MILLYPIVLFAAFLVFMRGSRSGSHEGPTWFVCWIFAGALFTFSLLTGFSVGLFVLPLAGVVLFWVASRAPGREAIGFLAGTGLVLLVAWPLVGLLLSALAMGAYAVPVRRA